MVAFSDSYYLTRFYEVLYNSAGTIDPYLLDYPSLSYYKDLPDCETEEELHRAIQL